MFVDGWTIWISQLDDCTTKSKGIIRALNQTVKEIDCRAISEVNTLIRQANCRARETKELDNITKDLLARFSVMEECICILEEESIVKAVMIHSLSLEVDFLKEQMCSCEKSRSRLLLGSGTCKDPFKLEYVLESKYVAPPVVTALVPLDAEVICDPSLALRFRDNEEEESVVRETQESLVSVADPEENKVPIPVHVNSPPPQYQESVCQGQRCVHSNGSLKHSLYHPYHCAKTSMEMPASLPSTRDFRHNLQQL